MTPELREWCKKHHLTGGSGNPSYQRFLDSIPHIRETPDWCHVLAAFSAGASCGQKNCAEGKKPSDWLDPEELNGRIALAVDAMNHARGFIEDADAHDLSPGPVLCAEQIERLDRGISALTDPSKY